MAQETFGEKTPAQLKAARMRIIKYGGVAALSLATFVYAFFFGLVPAVKDYKQIKEKICFEILKADKSRLDLGCEQRVHKSEPQKGSWLSPTAAYALIVNAGETALRDCFIATSCVSAQNFKFHGLGTSAAAAAEADTGCTTELSSQYNPDSTRATGSQANNGANVYRTVGTNTVDATAAVTEWCLMTQAATGGGTLWSRITFPTINLASGDSLQTTYDLTIE